MDASGASKAKRTGLRPLQRRLGAITSPRVSPDKFPPLPQARAKLR